MTPSTIYIICICALLLSCLLLIRKLYQFSVIILDVEEALEESLDILDEKYRSMNEVLQKPIFFDSVEVRQVVDDIRQCHDAVLQIANKLTRNMRNASEIKEKDSTQAQ